MRPKDDPTLKPLRGRLPASSAEGGPSSLLRGALGLAAGLLVGGLAAAALPRPLPAVAPPPDDADWPPEARS